jgi:hypothetical protein
MSDDLNDELKNYINQARKALIKHNSEEIFDFLYPFYYQAKKNDKTNSIGTADQFIAKIFGVSPKTITNYKSNLRTKKEKKAQIVFCSSPGSKNGSEIMMVSSLAMELANLVNEPKKVLLIDWSGINALKSIFMSKQNQTALMYIDSKDAELFHNPSTCQRYINDDWCDDVVDISGNDKDNKYYSDYKYKNIYTNIWPTIFNNIDIVPQRFYNRFFCSNDFNTIDDYFEPILYDYDYVLITYECNNFDFLKFFKKNYNIICMLDYGRYIDLFKINNLKYKFDKDIINDCFFFEGSLIIVPTFNHDSEVTNFNTYDKFRKNQSIDEIIEKDLMQLHGYIKNNYITDNCLKYNNYFETTKKMVCQNYETEFDKKIMLLENHTKLYSPLTKEIIKKLNLLKESINID